MSAQLNIFDQPLWERQEERLLELFRLALEIFGNQTLLGTRIGEAELNRRLYRFLRQANREFKLGFDHLPVCECANQPDGADDERHERESKIPDFQWELIDGLAPVEYSSRFYVVECKRLGSPTSPTWILNQNYILKGVCRFRDPSYGYGKSCPSAAMVGYVQDMELTVILDQVNTAGRDNGFPAIALEAKRWQKGAVSRLAQQFDRPFQPSPFQLRHLWVDLRGAQKK